jgi:hypothetical protein
MTVVLEAIYMRGSEINRELDRLDQRLGQLTEEMIEVGRGDELPTETRMRAQDGGDELANRLCACWDRRAELLQEIRERTGTFYHRMPPRIGRSPRRRRVIQ